MAKAHSRVYFAQALPGAPIKIGVSCDPIGRASQIRCPETGLQPAILFAGAGTRFAEEAMHDFFLRLAMGGEWFSCAPSILVLAARFQRQPEDTIERVRAANVAAGTSWAYARLLGGSNSPDWDHPLFTKYPRLRTVARFRLYSGTQWTTIPEAIALRAVMRGEKFRVSTMPSPARKAG